MQVRVTQPFPLPPAQKEQQTRSSVAFNRSSAAFVTGLCVNVTLPGQHELSLLPFLLCTALILFTFSFLFSLSLFQSFPPANGRGVHRLDCKSRRHSGLSSFSSYPGFQLFTNIFILIKPRPLHSVSKSPQMNHMGNETNKFIFSTILQIGETTFGIQQSWTEELSVPNNPLPHQNALELTCEPKSCRDLVDSCDDVIQRRKLQDLTTHILKWANGKSHAPQMRTRSRLPQRS